MDGKERNRTGKCPKDGGEAVREELLNFASQLHFNHSHSDSDVWCDSEVQV